MANIRAGSPRNQRKADFSGGVQTATSRLLRKGNEVVAAKNATFSKKIGSVARRDGYEQVGRTIQHGNDGLAGFVYKYGTNNKLMVGINDSNNTVSTVQYLDVDGYYSTIASLPTIAPNTRMHPINYLDESYWVGRAPDSDTYMQPFNLDYTLTASTTRNVTGMPKCRFVIEFQGRLYAINCQVGGTKYKDRAYLSSPATGAITFVQNDQTGLIQQLAVDSVRYLKAGMTVDIYSAGTEAKIVSALTIISVDKNQNKITFAPQTLSLKDNDEIWLTGRKGTLSIFWNTDYPTPESSDFLRVPPSEDETPEFTGVGKNNNRLFLFTKNSTLKWDGANLVPISDTIGCVSHETIRVVGNSIVWLHNTGVWSYNDANGQLQLLSRSVQNYIDAINQANLGKASAVAVGRVYKLSIGEIATLDSITTSTSTSSTSTSSTSSSTSSTSTSSTSTSTTTAPTSTSTSSTSSSTSSTSSSTSSTSTSSTSRSTSTSSTSISTSTSSTTTTTVASTKNVVRLVYDFNMNAWSPEFHKREQRFQFIHTMNGYTKPYFIDETGRLFRDETGNLDHQDTIPFEVEIGRDNFGTSHIKQYTGVYVDSERARLATVSIQIDNGEWSTIGQLEKDVQLLKIPFGTEGRDINYFISHNDNSDGPIIDGLDTYYRPAETAAP